MSVGRLFWRGAAAILVAAALVALVAVVRGRISDTDGRILLSLAALLYFGGTGLAGFAVIERARSVALGRASITGAVIGLALGLWGIWSFVWDGGSETPAKLAWSGTLTALALLMASTARLLARRGASQGIAAAVGAVAGVAAALSIAGIWAEPDEGAFVKLIFVLWILTVVGFFFVPVASRLSPTEVADIGGERVLASLDDVELVVVRDTLPESVEVRLAPGERVILRHRHDAVGA